MLSLPGVEFPESLGVCEEEGCSLSPLYQPTEEGVQVTLLQGAFFTEGKPKVTQPCPRCLRPLEKSRISRMNLG